ncbi:MULTISPECIES: hypothetical protein [unclassified Streptomyces]|nr:MULTISPECIES: hypothetical protein [unclassified Streptomyces]
MTPIAVDHVQLTAPPGSEAILRSFYADDLGMRSSGTTSCRGPSSPCGD